MPFYFNRFPKISYANTQAINLVTKLNMGNVARTTSSNYYPYVIKEGERPDHLARHYYEDASLSWLVHLANEHVDPYYDWPLGEDEFTAHLKEKHGSKEIANRTILFWRVNWRSNDSVLPISGYNALPSSVKKFWAPVLSEKGISHYERKQLDLTTETNMYQVLQYEGVDPVVGNTVEGPSGTGTVAHVNAETNSVTLKHVFGTISEGDTLTDLTTGLTTNALTNLQSHQNIPTEEVVYWEAITALTHETELNESRKNIFLINKNFLPQIDKEVEELFS